LEEERKSIMEAILDLDCFPAGMEMFPATDSEQFDFIKTIIDDSDYYVLILAGRYGSVDDDGISYTEKEYNYAVEKGIPILVFAKKDLGNIPVGKTDNNQAKKEKLEVFRNKAMENKLSKYWDTADELKYAVNNSLSKIFKTKPRTGWIRGDVENNEELLSQINKLKLENENLKKSAQHIEEITLDTLANGDDKYIIKVLHEDDYVGEMIQEECELTWNKIICLLGPSLLSPVFIGEIKHKFEQILGEQCTFGILDVDTEEYNISITNSDFEEILIQLMALDIIEQKNALYRLSDNGRRKLFSLKTVKKVNDSI